MHRDLLKGSVTARRLAQERKTTLVEAKLIGIK
jgi:hypothetical protein